VTQEQKKHRQIASAMGMLFAASAALAVSLAPGNLRDVDYLIVGTLSTAFVLVVVLGLVVARKL
jgi:hypothetical protein